MFVEDYTYKRIAQAFYVNKRCNFSVSCSF